MKRLVLGSLALAAMIAGFVPAFRASWLNAATAAKGGTTVSANRADRKILGGVAMAQTALTLVLLVGAGLLIRTVANLARIDPGYDTQRIIAMTVVPLTKMGATAWGSERSGAVGAPLH